jgi:NAD(P)-dependent dehydrogenase (short-subunit alcohol dehydrogenase family)
MSGLLEGKSALVTGAASGIRRASALAFSRQGSRVMLADVDESEGERAAEAIREAGGEARFARTDVTREDEVEAMVHETFDAFGAAAFLISWRRAALAPCRRTL